MLCARTEGFNSAGATGATGTVSIERQTRTPSDTYDAVVPPTVHGADTHPPQDTAQATRPHAAHGTDAVLFGQYFT
eukprot:11181919-Lingulodinium_polyedra.AAC.1